MTKGSYIQRKIQRIVDLDEALGECDMNYDYELVAHQAKNPETCERDFSGAVYVSRRKFSTK